MACERGGARRDGRTAREPCSKSRLEGCAAVTRGTSLHPECSARLSLLSSFERRDGLEKEEGYVRVGGNGKWLGITRSGGRNMPGRLVT